MVARGWSAAQVRAYRIADNKLAENAGWDEELLQAEFADLRAADFDVLLTGFSASELLPFEGESTETVVRPAVLCPTCGRFTVRGKGNPETDEAPTG